MHTMIRDSDGGQFVARTLLLENCPTWPGPAWTKLRISNLTELFTMPIGPFSLLDVRAWPAKEAELSP